MNVKTPKWKTICREGQVNWRLEIIAVVSMLLLTTISVMLVYHLWNKNVHVPIVFDGDGLGAVVTIKNIIEGNSFLEYPSLSAPFTENVYLQDYFLETIIIRIIATFTKDVGIVTNIFWFMTYILTAITMYILCRKIKLQPAIAVMCALIYDFLPYHFFRMPHFWLFGCYVIPLAAILIVDIIESNYIFDNKINVKKLMGGCAIAILVGINGLYYSVFTMILLGAALVYSLFQQRIWKNIICTIWLWGIIAISVVGVMIVPLLISGSNAFAEVGDSRTLYQINVFALSIVYMLLPIPGHRIEGLSNITLDMYEQLGANENYMACLGGVMSLGYIISVVYGLFDRKNNEPLVKKIGTMNLVTTIVAISGGLDIFIGYFVSTSIRCYNRMSVFIALFSVLVVGIGIQRIIKKIKKVVVKYFVICLIIVIAILDQTSAKFSTNTNFNCEELQYDSAYTEIEESYIQLSAYMQKIESNVGENAMIYQMPSVRASSNDDEWKFYPLQAYIVSDGIKWSSSLSTVGEQQQWLNQMEELESNELVEILAFNNFDGILIDKTNYSESKFRKIRNELEKKMNIKPLISEDGLLYFYNIKQYKNERLSEYSQDEIDNIKEALNNVMIAKNYKVDLQTFAYQEKKDLSNNRVLVNKGTYQYGPYWDMKAGKYIVTVMGDQLLNASYDCLADLETDDVGIKEIRHTDTLIQYELCLEKDMDNVEVRLFGKKGSFILEQYYLGPEQGEWSENIDKNLDIYLKALESEE